MDEVEGAAWSGQLYSRMFEIGNMGHGKDKAQKAYIVAMNDIKSELPIVVQSAHVVMTVVMTPP